MDHQYIETNGIRLHVLQDGPKDAPLVILLHGFPDFSYGWKHQIPYLASAGYRVWAPDLRGCNLSDKPDGLASYYLDVFAADVVGLMEAAGQKQVFLVGHDVGGSIAWWVANQYPDRLSKMVILNIPNAAAKIRLRGNFTQLLKLWYVLFFQLPWLPEFLCSRQNWNLLVQMLKNSSRPGTFTDSDLDRYRQAWSQPKAFTSMLNWYRAGLRKLPTPPANPRITVPTLLIWGGAQDALLGREMAQPSIDICDNGRLVFIEEGTHWVQDEEPERVNALIGTFLRDGMKD